MCKIGNTFFPFLCEILVYLVGYDPVTLGLLLLNVFAGGLLLPVSRSPGRSELVLGVPTLVGEAVGNAVAAAAAIRGTVPVNFYEMSIP